MGETTPFAAPSNCENDDTPVSGWEEPAEQASGNSEIALYGVYEISKVLSEPGRLEVTLGKVLHLLSSFLDMRHGLIALLGERGDPEVVVGSGWSEATAKRYFERLPERAIGQIVVTQMPLVIPDMRKEPLFEGWDFSGEGAATGTIAFIGVPIMERGQVVGTLTIDRDVGTQRTTPLDEDARFLAMVANLVGQTVRLQRLIARDRERIMEDRDRLEKTVERKTAPDVKPAVGGIVGDSAAIRAVLEKVRVAARSNSTVLLRGESGTGKELFARALHDLSPRSERVFLSVNCAALPEAMLESELFGHEKGAFTGAMSQRKGRFELADGGTLFLDEIGEISTAFQAKLLRVLQEGEFERVGGSTTLKVNVRLVAATNRNLEQAVSQREFRADLYYRISVIPIFLPPLRDRPAISLLSPPSFFVDSTMSTESASRLGAAGSPCSRRVASPETYASSRTVCAARRRSRRATRSSPGTSRASTMSACQRYSGRGRHARRPSDTSPCRLGGREADNSAALPPPRRLLPPTPTTGPRVPPRLPSPRRRPTRDRRRR